MLFVDDDRQLALETVKFAFQYARAKAALLKSEKTFRRAAPAPPTSAAGGPAKSGTAALPGLAGLMARAQQQHNNLNQLKQQAEQLKAESARANATRRAALARQLAIVQSQESNSPNRDWTRTTRSSSSRAPQY